MGGARRAGPMLQRGWGELSPVTKLGLDPRERWEAQAPSAFKDALKQSDEYQSPVSGEGVRSFTT